MAEKWSSKNCLDKLVALLYLLSCGMCEISSTRRFSVGIVEIGASKK